jgi:hypothetical protein
MSKYIKELINARKRKMAQTEEIKLRKHLNADVLFNTVRTGSDGIRDHRSWPSTHYIPAPPPYGRFRNVFY